MKRLALAFAPLVSAAAPRAAEEFTGNTYLKKCRPLASGKPLEVNEIFSAGQCSSMLQTFGTFYRNYLQEMNVCVPRGVTKGQVAATYVAYLDRNPSMRHMDVGGLLAAAMLEAWPCPKAQ